MCAQPLPLRPKRCPSRNTGASAARGLSRPSCVAKTRRTPAVPNAGAVDSSGSSRASPHRARPPAGHCLVGMSMSRPGGKRSPMRRLMTRLCFRCSPLLVTACRGASELAREGPRGAIRVCRGEAQAVTATVAREQGILVGRASHRLRIGLVDQGLVTTIVPVWSEVRFRGSVCSTPVGKHPLSLVRPRAGPPHLHDLDDPAGGLHNELPDLPTGDPALGVHVPGDQHAGGLSVVDALQSGTPLHRDRPRRLSQGSIDRCVTAAAGCAHP